MADSELAPGSEAARRKNRRMVLILAVFVSLGLGYGTYRMWTYNPNYVVHVDHADRILLKSDTGLRLIGIEVNPVQDKQVGEPAAKFVAECILGKYIRIERDVRKEDRGGWILAYVFVQSEGREIFLNLELLRRGLAKHLPAAPNLKYRKEFEAAEAEAKGKQLGFWSPDYTPLGSRL